MTAVSPATELSARALEAFLEARTSPRLILLRHGRTEWNVDRRLQGQKDSPLDSLGLDQARTFGELLANIPLAQLLCSDLGRCTRTARAIAERNATVPEVVATPLLREMALGLLEGELKQVQSSREARDCYRELCRDEINFRVPGGGESLRDVYARVSTFFEGAEDALAARGNHLIVGHRNVNKMVIKHWLGLSFEDGFRVEHENQRIYIFFPATKELWSCTVDDTGLSFHPGYVTSDDVYA